MRADQSNAVARVKITHRSRTPATALTRGIAAARPRVEIKHRQRPAAVKPRVEITRRRRTPATALTRGIAAARPHAPITTRRRSAARPNAWSRITSAPRGDARQVWFADPFGYAPRRLEIPAGLTIAEMVHFALTAGDVPAELEPLVRVHVNGNEIPRVNWRAITPDAGAHLSLIATPQGSGSGRKVLSSIAMIAIVALSVWTGGATSGALASAGYGSTASAIGGALASTGVSMVGGLALQALLGNDDSSSVRYTFNGVGNETLTKNSPVPIVLGTRRIYPKLAATTWTDVHDIDDDGDYYTYLNLILFWSVGRVSYSDLKIGESDITAFEDYTVEDHLSPSDDMPSLCTAIWPREDAISTELRYSYGWVTRRTRTNTTKIEVVLSWPSGLYGLNGKNSYSVKLAMQYRAVGDTEWIDAPTGGTFTVKKKVFHVFFKKYEWSVDSGQYDIRIKRTNKDDWSLDDDDQGKRQTTAYWLYLHSYGEDLPIQNAENFSFSTLRIKATNQVNGTLAKVNAVVSSVVPKWNGTEFDTDDYDVSRNPGELLHWYVTSDVTAQSQSGSTDDDVLGAWAEECETNGWYCDFVADSGSMQSVMSVLAAAGQGFGTVWQDGLLSVSVDDERSSPVQLFSARNVRNFRGNITFPNAVHAVQVVYDDNTLNYESQTITVYATGYDEDTATLFETIKCPYKTDYSAAYILGWRYLAARELRPETYTFDTWTEGLAVSYGARCDVAHWAMSVGIQGSRIRSLTLDSDGNVAGLVMDDYVTMESGTSYVLRVQRGSSTGTFNITTVAGSSNALTLETPVSADSFGVVGNPVIFGVADKETLPAIVVGIEVKNDKSVSLTCIPYASGMQANGGTIPDWDPVITSRAVSTATCGSRALSSADADAANDNKLSTVLANQAQTAGQSDDISDAISSVEGLLEPEEFSSLASILTGSSLAAMVAAADLQEQSSESLQVSEAKASALISQVKTVAVSASAAVADLTTTLDAELESVSSEFTEEIQTLSEDLESVTTDLKTLSSTVSSNYSTLSDELQTVSDDQETYATKLTSLTSTVDDNTADITEEAQTRASADSSISNTLTSVKSTLGNISADGYLSITSDVNSSSGSVTVTAAALLSTSSSSAIAAWRLYADSSSNSYFDIYAGRVRIIDPDTNSALWTLNSDGTIDTDNAISSEAITQFAGYQETSLSSSASTDTVDAPDWLEKQTGKIYYVDSDGIAVSTTEHILAMLTFDCYVTTDHTVKIRCGIQGYTGSAWETIDDSVRRGQFKLDDLDEDVRSSLVKTFVSVAVISSGYSKIRGFIAGTDSTDGTKTMHISNPVNLIVLRGKK